MSHRSLSPVESSFSTTLPGSTQPSYQPHAAANASPSASVAVTASVLGAAALFYWARRSRARDTSSTEGYIPGHALVAVGDPYEDRQGTVPSSPRTQRAAERRRAADLATAERTKLALDATHVLQGHGAWPSDRPNPSVASGNTLKQEQVFLLEVADLLREAVARQAHRRDLQQKLLEVLFAIGARDEFVAEATRYRAKFAKETDGAWATIRRMGESMAPENPLFSLAALA